MINVLNSIITYSTLIQTTCAVLGLILGIFALIFAIHQINISQKQRSFHLKSEFLKDSFDAMQIVEKIEEKIKITKIEFQEAILNESDYSIKESYQNKIAMIEKLAPTVVEAQKELNKMFNQIHKKEIHLTIKELEESLTERIQLLSFISECDSKLNELILLCRFETKQKKHIKSQEKKIQEQKKIIQDLEKKTNLLSN